MTRIETFVRADDQSLTGQSPARLRIGLQFTTFTFETPAEYNGPTFGHEGQNIGGGDSVGVLPLTVMASEGGHRRGVEQTNAIQRRKVRMSSRAEGIEGEYALRNAARSSCEDYVAEVLDLAGQTRPGRNGRDVDRETISGDDGLVSSVVSDDQGCSRVGCPNRRGAPGRERTAGRASAVLRVPCSTIDLMIAYSAGGGLRFSFRGFASGRSPTESRSGRRSGRGVHLARVPSDGRSISGTA